MFIGIARYVVAALLFILVTAFWSWQDGVMVTIAFLLTELIFAAAIS